MLSLTGVPLAQSAPVTSGLFPSFGNTLLDHGIDFHGALIDHFIANPSAGNTPGNVANLGLINITTDLDLDRILGIAGGKAHVGLAYFFLKANEPNIVFETGGTLTGYQTTPHRYPLDLSLLTYEQDLLNNRLQIEFGRTNLYHYFFIPNGIDPLNQESTVIFADLDVAPIVFPVWGARVKYYLDRSWYVQFGGFEDNFTRSVNNGNNFGDRTADGAQFLVEGGERTSFANARYPSNLEFGVITDTSNGGVNLKGSPIPYTPRGAAANYKGATAFYTQGEQVLWRGTASRPGLPPPNIALYGSTTTAANMPQPIDFDSIVGFNFTGLIPGRPFDELSLQTHYQRLSQIESRFETRVHTLLRGSRTQQARDNYQFEAAYNLQVTRWAALVPYGEYFTAPDDYLYPLSTNRPHDGFMAGFIVTVSLGTLLGTSQKPF